MAQVEENNFVGNFLRSGSVPIHFIVCRDAMGFIAHYFLMCSPQKLKLALRQQEGIVPLNEYGTIVGSGYGEIPSEMTKRMLKEQYHYDYDANCH